MDGWKIKLEHLGFKDDPDFNLNLVYNLGLNTVNTPFILEPVHVLICICDIMLHLI